MSCERRPWFPWYPKDYGQDEKVKGLSDDAELLYRRALDVMWVASDLRLLNARSTLVQQLARGWSTERFEAAWSELQTPGFELLKTSEDGKWVYSKRLKKEAERIEKISQKNSEAGRKSAAKRTSNARSTPVQRMFNHPDPDPDNKKDNKLSFSSDSDQMRLAHYLFAYIKRNNPQAKEPIFETWARQFDAIIRIDKRAVDDIKAVIEWCQNDDFWKANILSPNKLRKQFDQLWLKMNAKAKAKDDKEGWI